MLIAEFDCISLLDNCELKKCFLHFRDSSEGNDAPSQKGLPPSKFKSFKLLTNFVADL